MGLKFYFLKFWGRITGKNQGETEELINDYFRKRGAIIGKDCKIYSDISTPESYLIKIGNNVTISNGVQLITHDNSIIKVAPEYTDIFGEIRIGDNCFIGARTVILPGVTLGDNCIVGAGSLVTKSFENNVVLAGNPAKAITDTLTYRNKIASYGLNIEGLSSEDKRKLVLKHKNKMISR